MDNVAEYEVVVDYPETVGAVVTKYLSEGWDIWGLPQLIPGPDGSKRWAQAVIKRTVVHQDKGSGRPYWRGPRVRRNDALPPLADELGS